MEHPALQIFNLTNFLNNVSCLQSKLDLESAATVTFSSLQVVPPHSPPPSFVQAHPCLESQAIQPLHDPHSLLSPRSLSDPSSASMAMCHWAPMMTIFI